MAGLVVADTDVVINFLRGRGPGARLIHQLLVERRLRLTSVTGFALRVGADFLARRDQILRLFRSWTLALDLASAQRAAEIAASEQASRPSDSPTACRRESVCGTDCRSRQPPRHFNRVEGLELVDVDVS